MSQRLVALLGALFCLVCLLNSFRVFYHSFKHASTPHSRKVAVMPQGPTSIGHVPSKDASSVFPNKLPGCRDTLANCASMAKAKECVLNPSVLLRSCAESCGVCTRLTPSNSRVVKLRSGAYMPRIGFGTAGLGELTRNATLQALRIGYRHIDSAQSRLWYREDLVGQAIAESGVPRNELFLTSKLHPSHLGYETTKLQFEQSTRDLGTDYLDLFLLHYPRCFGSICRGSVPNGTWESSWEALEDLSEAGKIRDIGVSNFSLEELARLLQIARISPSVVQRHSDIVSQDRLIQGYCELNGIQYVAYSSLGTQHRDSKSNPVLGNSIVKTLALKYDISPAQLVLQWALQNNQVILPRSKSKERAEENLLADNHQLSAKDMSLLYELDEFA